MSLRRGKPLRADPEKVRAWRDRSRAPLPAPKRPLPRSDLRADRRTDGREAPATRPRGGKKRRSPIPKRVRARVYARSGGLCVCGCGRKCTHVHHVLPVGSSITSWPHLELIEQNMVGMYWRCHLAHENAQPRLRRARLPQCALELARQEGPVAEDYIVRTYPAVPA